MKEQNDEVFERALWMVRNNRYWSSREAAVVLARFADSGLSIADFARRHGIPDKRIRRWKEKLPSPRALVANEVGTAAEHTISLVPVRVVAESIEPTRATVFPSPLEVVVHGGRAVRVPAGFDSETLARVVTVLEALPC
ncbi:MAG: transposase [Polyangiaceae bacterium]|nr:transposase [Polyangiaceae bacterium]